MTTHDIIIVGAGTAGMTAALYALRSGKTVLLLEKETVGGQIAISPRVENFPTIPVLTGEELSNRLFSQVMDLGAGFELEEVEFIQKKDDLFYVKTDYATHQSRAVILANGVTRRPIGVAGEEELVGKGISYCAICDGPFYAGEDVTLIGDANSAAQYALLLAGYCKSVTVFTLFDKYFADDSLVKAIRKKENIKTFHNQELVAFEKNEKGLTALVFYDKTKKEQHTVPTHSVFIAVGQIPQNDKYQNLAALDQQGYFLADESCKTQTEGLFVAGDCRKKQVRQLTTAASDGAVAATAACQYLNR